MRDGDRKGKRKERKKEGQKEGSKKNLERKEEKKKERTKERKKYIYLCETSRKRCKIYFYQFSQKCNFGDLNILILNFVLVSSESQSAEAL